MGLKFTPETVKFFYKAFFWVNLDFDSYSAPQIYINQQFDPNFVRGVADQSFWIL